MWQRLSPSQLLIHLFTTARTATAVDRCKFLTPKTNIDRLINTWQSLTRPGLSDSQPLVFYYFDLVTNSHYLAKVYFMIIYLWNNLPTHQPNRPANGQQGKRGGQKQTASWLFILLESHASQPASQSASTWHMCGIIMID